MPQSLRLNLYRRARRSPTGCTCKMLKLGEPVPISDLLPMLENFGLRVISERPYELVWPEGGAAWIQDFELEHRDGARIDIARIEPLVQGSVRGNAGAARSRTTASIACCSSAGLDAREIVVMRAYCKYLLQTGVPFSQASIERTLAGNSGITQNLVRLFETLFSPANKRAGRRARREDRRRRSARHSMRWRASTKTASCVRI